MEFDVDLYENESAPNNHPLYPDAVFEINGDGYHLECESKLDQNISIRVQRYNKSIQEKHDREFSSGVVFTKYHRDISHLNIDESYKTFEVNKYELKDLVNQELYFVLPFVVLKYYSQLTNDKPTLSPKVLKADKEFRESLQNLKEGGKLSEDECQDILDFYVIIRAHLLDLKAKKTDAREEPEVEILTRRELYQQGLEQGLEALVNTIKKYHKDFQSLYEEVISNEAYANVTEEQVKKYY